MKSAIQGTTRLYQAFELSELRDWNLPRGRPSRVDLLGWGECWQNYLQLRLNGESTDFNDYKILSCRAEVEASKWAYAPEGRKQSRMIFNAEVHTRALMEAQDRKYLTELARVDSDKFLKEMTPRNELSSGDQGRQLGLDLTLPHHQKLQEDFSGEVARILAERSARAKMASVPRSVAHALVGVGTTPKIEVAKPAVEAASLRAAVVVSSAPISVTTAAPAPLAVFGQYIADLPFRASAAIGGGKAYVVDTVGNGVSQAVQTLTTMLPRAATTETAHQSIADGKVGAILVDAAYCKNIEELRKFIRDNGLEKHEVLERIEDSLVGYSAFSIRNSETRELLVVGRGTDNLINAWDDICIHVLGRTPLSYDVAEKFVQSTVKKFGNVDGVPYLLYLAGHSEGGDLSVLLHRTRDGTRMSQGAIAYDAPGVQKSVLDALAVRGKMVHDGEGCVYWMGPPNVVNMWGKREGTVVNIQLHDEHEGKITAMEAFLLRFATLQPTPHGKLLALAGLATLELSKHSIHWLRQGSFSISAGSVSNFEVTATQVREAFAAANLTVDTLTGKTRMQQQFDSAVEEFVKSRALLPSTTVPSSDLIVDYCRSEVARRADEKKKADIGRDEWMRGILDRCDPFLNPPKTRDTPLEAACKKNIVFGSVLWWLCTHTRDFNSEMIRLRNQKSLSLPDMAKLEGNLKKLEKWLRKLQVYVDDYSRKPHKRELVWFENKGSPSIYSTDLLIHMPPKFGFEISLSNLKAFYAHFERSQNELQSFLKDMPLIRSIETGLANAIRLKNNEDVLSFCNAYLGAIDSSSSPHLFLRASALRKLNRLEEALDAYKAIIDMKPDQKIKDLLQLELAEIHFKFFVEMLTNKDLECDFSLMADHASVESVVVKGESVPAPVTMVASSVGSALSALAQDSLSAFGRIKKSAGEWTWTHRWDLLKAVVIGGIGGPGALVDFFISKPKYSSPWMSPKDSAVDDGSALVFSNFLANWEKKAVTTAMAASLRDAPSNIPGFAIRRVEGDGNCLFRAVAAQMEAMDHEILRAHAVEYAIAHLDELAGFLETSRDEFIAALTTPGEWADDLVIRILGGAINGNFMVHRTDGTINPLNYGVTESARTFHVLYNGVHYDALIENKTAHAEVSVPAKPLLSAPRLTGAKTMQEACLTNSLKLVEVLYKAGQFNVEEKTMEGYNYLMLAALEGHHEIVDFWFKHGISIHVQDELGRTALMLAAGRGHVHIIDNLLGEVPDPIIRDAKDSEGHQAIHYAAAYNQLTCLKSLLSKGADLEAQTTKKLETPLFLATIEGAAESVFFLLESGAKTECIMSGSSSWPSKPVYLAAEHGRIDILKQLLLQNPDIKIYNNHYSSYYGDPLCLAAQSGNLKTLRFLMDFGFSLDKRDHRKLALQSAVIFGYEEAVKILLTRGANISATAVSATSGHQARQRDEKDETPLCLAVESGQVQMVEFLLSAGAKIDEKKFHNGNALIVSFAAKEGNISIVELFLNHGFNVNQIFYFQSSLLGVAAKAGHVPMLRFLLERGAEVDVLQSHGDTPLCYAVESGSLEAVMLLLKYGADIHYINKDGENLLHYYCKHNNSSAMLRFLIAQQLDINQVSSRFTPLCMAASYGSIESMAILLDAGARLGLHGDNPKSDIFACALTKPPAMQFLISRGIKSDYFNSAEGRTALHYHYHKTHISHEGRYYNLIEVLEPLMMAEMPLDLNLAAYGERTVDILLEQAQSMEEAERWSAKGGVLKSDKAQVFLLNSLRKGDISFIEWLLEHGGNLHHINPSTGATLLHQAAEEMNIFAIAFLLSRGLEVNALDKRDSTPLHYLVQRWGRSSHAVNFLACTELLFRHSANPDILGGHQIKQACIHLAVQQGNIHLVLLLFKHRANVSLQSSNGQSPFLLALEVARTTYDRSGLGQVHLSEPSAFDMIRFFLERNPELIYEQSGRCIVYIIQGTQYSEGRYPAHGSAEQAPRYVALAELIIELMVDVNRPLDPSGTTMLERCLTAGQIGLAKKLVAKGARIEWTKISYQGDLDHIKFLFSLAIPPREKLNKLLASAAHTHSFRIVQFLVEAGAEVSSVTSDASVSWPGTSLLHLALSGWNSVPLETEKERDAAYLETVRFLLDKGADVRYISPKQQMSAFHFFARARGTEAELIEVAQLLLAAGADLRIRNSDGQTPLEMALYNGNVILIGFFLAHGARLEDVPLECPYAGYKTNFLERAIGLGMIDVVRHFLGRGGVLPNVAILCSRYSGNLEMLTFCLDQGLNINEIWTPDTRAPQLSYTPISWLINSEYQRAKSNAGRSQPLDERTKLTYTLVQLLLERGAILDITLSETKKFFEMAVAIGAIELVALLVSRGMSVNQPLTSWRFTQRGTENQVDPEKTLLHVALSGEGNIAVRLEMVKFLLANHANFHAVDAEGKTPLHKACESGEVAMVEVLIECHASALLLDNRGLPPLYLACEKGYEVIMIMLLNQGVPVDQENRFGWTALDVACENGDMALIQLLLKRMANPRHMAKDGVMPIHRAAYGGTPESLKFLLSFDSSLLEQEDQAGRTPLYWAAQEGNVDTLILLIAQKADHHHCARNGKTPLQAAMYFGRCDAVWVLLKQADIVLDINTSLVTQFLFKAIDDGHLKVLQELITRGIDLNQCNREKRSLLCYALKQYTQQPNYKKLRYFEMLALLLEKGADPNLLDLTGVRPLAEVSRSEVLRLLLSYGADVRLPLEGRREWSILHSGRALHDIKMLQVLLEFGFNPNEPSPSGYTLIQQLYDVSQEKNLLALRLLLKFGADLEIKRPDGKAAFELLGAHASPELMEELRRIPVVSSEELRSYPTVRCVFQLKSKLMIESGSKDIVTRASDVVKFWMGQLVPARFAGEPVETKRP